MIEVSDIVIKKLIVHILDNTLGIPVLSDTEHELNNDIEEFMGKHIAKVWNDHDLKKADFINPENRVRKACRVLAHNGGEFTAVTQEIAAGIFNIMNNQGDIPSADLACCQFMLNNARYLGVLKFNYKPSYIHYVEENSEGRVNSIIKQKTALPNENQKLEECIFINLDDESIHLKEKPYEIDGEKQFYISTRVLECTSDLSEREKVDILNKSTKNFVKKYYNEDIVKLADLKNAAMHSVGEKNEININDIADTVFQHDQEMKAMYIQEVKKGGLTEDTIQVNENLEKRVTRKQRLVTDNGIEIKLPLEYMNSREKVEFISNPDGTLSILIKNVGQIVDK